MRNRSYLPSQATFSMALWLRVLYQVHHDLRHQRMSPRIIRGDNLDAGILPPCLVDKVGNVLRHMRSRLHKKRDNNDSAGILPRAVFNRVFKRRHYILHKRMLDDIVSAELFHVGNNAPEGVARAGVFAPMPEDYDSGLHED